MDCSLPRDLASFLHRTLHHPFFSPGLSQAKIFAEVTKLETFTTPKGAVYFRIIIPLSFCTHFLNESKGFARGRAGCPKTVRRSSVTGGSESYIILPFCRPLIVLVSAFLPLYQVASSKPSECRFLSSASPVLPLFAAIELTSRPFHRPPIHIGRSLSSSVIGLKKLALSSRLDHLLASNSLSLSRRDFPPLHRHP